MAIHPSARGFHAAAGDYERARPEYPDEAGRWLAQRLDLRPGRVVADIAAGTGKLTRLLARTGAEVVAIEPVAGMRARLAAALPDVQLLNGVAEEVPLEDGSVDAATVAQAFHWFDADQALRDIHRVVRDRGRLAVIYNRRLLDDPVQAGIEAIIGPLHDDTPAHRSGRWRTAFDQTHQWAALDRREFAHVQPLDRDGVVRRVASVSYIANLPVERRTEVLDQVRGFIRGRAEPIGLPYRCELLVWERIP